MGQGAPVDDYVDTIGLGVERLRHAWLNPIEGAERLGEYLH